MSPSVKGVCLRCGKAFSVETAEVWLLQAWGDGVRLDTTCSCGGEAVVTKRWWLWWLKVWFEKALVKARG